MILYSRKVWQGECLVENLLFWSIWQKKFGKQIARSAKGLLIVITTFDGFSLANHRQFAKFDKLSCYAVFMYNCCSNKTINTWSAYTLSFIITNLSWLCFSLISMDPITDGGGFWYGVLGSSGIKLFLTVGLPTLLVTVHKIFLFIWCVLFDLLFWGYKLAELKATTSL